MQADALAAVARALAGDAALLALHRGLHGGREAPPAPGAAGAAATPLTAALTVENTSDSPAAARQSIAAYGARRAESLRLARGADPAGRLRAAADAAALRRALRAAVNTTIGAGAGGPLPALAVSDAALLSGVALPEPLVAPAPQGVPGGFVDPLADPLRANPAEVRARALARRFWAARMRAHAAAVLRAVQ